MLRPGDQQTPDAETLLRLAERTGLVDDPEIQELVHTAITTENTQLKRRIQQILAAKAAKNQAFPFDTTPPSNCTQTPAISLGMAVSGHTYTVEEDTLTQHLLAVGQSGAGKTTFFYNLMQQLSVPFWSFDLKQDYRHLLYDDALDLLVLPWTELRFNPLKPPENVPLRRWAQVFSDVFGHATALLSGSKNYLMTQVIELYQLYDLFDTRDGPWPSLHELQSHLDEDKINYVRKRANYRDTVQNRLEAMNLTAGTVFDCSEGYSIEHMLDRNVVFEFDGLGADVQDFLMEILFAYVYEYRVAQNQRGGRLRHVFFLDEGKRVFSVYKERQDAAGLPKIDELTAQMREFGEGLVVADQEAGKLTDSIKANTYTKVLLPTGDSKQFNEIVASMGLTERQQNVAQQLKIGEAIVQTGNRDPVPVQLDSFDLEKTVSDTELRWWQFQEWNQLSFEPRQERPRDTADPDPENQEEEDVDLSDDAIRLLRDVIENPFKQLSKRYELFSSAYRGNKAKNHLVSSDILVEREVKTPRGAHKLLELTHQGREFVEDELGWDTSQEGRGGIVHRYWQHRIRDMFESTGWMAKLEMSDADVYARLDDTEVAVEVAMGNNERELDHIRKHIEAGYEAVWVFCKNEDVRDGLKKRMEENGPSVDPVAFRLFQDVRTEDIDAL